MSGSRVVGYTVVMGMFMHRVTGWCQGPVWCGFLADGALAIGVGFGSPVSGEGDFNPAMKIIIKPPCGAFRL